MVDVEVAPWLKGIPVAPEFHPTEAEFSDPITFILRIEEEAGQFGICKVVPPVPKQPRKSFIWNLNSSIAAAQGKQTTTPTNANSFGKIKFATKRQRVGKKNAGADPAAASAATYTLEQFDAKAKAFSRGLLGTTKDVSSLALETLFWRSIEEEEDQIAFVEYADDIPGSAFPDNGSSDSKKRKKGGKEKDLSGWKLANSPWNMRSLAQLQGSLFKFMTTAVPGVTSPNISISMLFAWAAWHIEEHELHSLNYLHTGSSKTWYAVPPEAASAFEDVQSRAALEESAIMSPEELLLNGIPCCRLVQNAGEYVIAFPRSYNFNVNHGFNCGEACNFAAPGWLKVAKQAAAAQRFALDRPPVFCHEQLLYQAALAFSNSSMASEEVRSSRLKHKKKLNAGEAIKAEFLSDFMQNQQVLDKMPLSRRILLLECAKEEGDKENLCNLVNLGNIDSISLLSFVCESMQGSDDKVEKDTSSAAGLQSPRVDWGALSCAVCGILCYSCIAIIQPTPEASKVCTADEEKRWRRSESFTSRSASVRSCFKERSIANGSGATTTLPACIFCPDHALQVYTQLEHCRVLVVHHPDYQTFEKSAKQIAKDMSMEFLSNDLRFDKGNDDDFHLISVATEARVPGNWVSRLQLSNRGTVHAKENNKSISLDSDDEDELLVEKTLKEKKCWVVGRWCGRVWRYDQAHVLLGGCISPADVRKATTPGNIHAAADSTTKPAKERRKRKDNPFDEELHHANANENPRKNCRKKRRTQMVADWRVESEPVPFSNSSVIEAVREDDIEMVDLIDATAAQEELPTADAEELQQEQEREEIPCVSEAAWEVAGNGAGNVAEHVVGDVAEDIGVEDELQPAEQDQFATCVGEPDIEPACGDSEIKPAEEIQSPNQPLDTDCKEAPENELKTDELPPPDSVDQGSCLDLRPTASGKVCKGEEEQEIEAAVHHRPMQWEEEPGSDFPSTSGGADEKPSFCEEEEMRRSEMPAPEHEEPTHDLGHENSPGSAPQCLANNSVWHDVPISFSPTFRASAMERGSAADWPSSSSKLPGSFFSVEVPAPPVYLNRRNKTRVVQKRSPDHDDDDLEGEAVEEISGEAAEAASDQEERDQPDSDVSTSFQDLFTSAEDRADDGKIGDDIASTRSRRTKRKSWKALAAVEDERPAKASRKSTGTKKTLSSTRKSSATKRKAVTVEAEAETDSEEVHVHTCDFEGCTMSFSTGSDLALHKRNICTIKECGKRLCSHSYLMQHYRVHVDDRPLKCPWKGCKKTFKWSWARTEHIRVHTGERPYVCNDCGKSYRFVSDFSRHKRTTGHST